MSCCGKAKSMIVGHAKRVAADRLRMSVPGAACRAKRMYVCHHCDQSTWLTKAFYGLWLARHGGIAALKDDVLRLPIEPDSVGRAWFCAVCKCHIPAKTFVEDEKCPLGKW